MIATWEKTGRLCLIHLSKAELDEFLTSTTARSHGAHVISMFNRRRSNWLSYGLSEVKKDLVVQTNDRERRGFKLRLKFEISCNPDERERQQIEEYLQDRSMYTI